MEKKGDEIIDVTPLGEQPKDKEQQEKQRKEEEDEEFRKGLYGKGESRDFIDKLLQKHPTTREDKLAGQEPKTFWAKAMLFLKMKLGIK
jgi:hypothetical protein